MFKLNDEVYYIGRGYGTIRKINPRTKQVLVQFGEELNDHSWFTHEGFNHGNGQSKQVLFFADGVITDDEDNFVSFNPDFKQPRFVKEFEPFEQVLVIRMYKNTRAWCPSIYLHTEVGPYGAPSYNCVTGNYSMACILPYKGNEHLLMQPAEES